MAIPSCHGVFQPCVCIPMCSIKPYRGREGSREKGGASLSVLKGFTYSRASIEWYLLGHPVLLPPKFLLSVGGGGNEKLNREGFRRRNEERVGSLLFPFSWIL